MTRFTVPGPPVPKGRPRLGKGGHVFTPDQTRAYERKVALLALAIAGLSLVAVPVGVALLLWVAASLVVLVPRRRP